MKMIGAPPTDTVVSAGIACPLKASVPVRLKSMTWAVQETHPKQLGHLGRERLLLLPICFAQDFYCLQLFFLQSGIDRGQLFIGQLAEVSNHIFQFAA